VADVYLLQFLQTGSTGKMDGDKKIIDALAIGLCTYDWRMNEEGFEPDRPCEGLCSYCVDQARYLIEIVKKEQM
jgi:hypothetical protein